jgi:cytochrome c553
MQHPGASAAGTLLILALLGFGVAASGVMPITASSGHWAATEWLLDFAKRRSVKMHALLVSAPPQDLDASYNVLRGAGHFETGCRPCHGAPGDALPPIAGAMTPPPPQLAPRISRWDAPELFYIVKHGVKFTGMPAWPTQRRDDEVWAMAAFLRRLPRLSATEYREMVRDGGTTLGELFAGTTTGVTAPDIVVDLCARCHGSDGQGRGVAAFPKLAGQRLEFMMNAMHAYADGRRISGMMGPIAAGLPEESRHAALRYYASLPPMTASAAAGTSGDATRGAAIAAHGVPAAEIPSCGTCHSNRNDVLEAYPKLHGQYAEYLSRQLRLLQQRNRGGSEYVHIMHEFVDRITERQIDDLSAYFGTAGAR